ncbi:GNAT family N-acetyltransferase [Myroides sp. 1354]|uniref:GNAT family N-acetyltransferase n=1 Tax=unclassified Myroides TaxID=2642485 RepID=UPI0025764CDA|nr:MULTISPECIES: GNAT family N-acetyltransferase [unclassified Myroides]MDM1046369.1 GNAT family N-acetyltransferase [Myroides sp. R163-1]MDM1057306.1 GNAT family N-acetyltransferase [Myroides sp. 1354]MDM1070459.1 GNAT family N-acetyltransferase [Myroides sp. 1372]
MNYTIKKASLEDLKEASELFNLYRIFYQQESDLQGSTTFIKERLLHGESDIFLAMIDNKAVGFVQLYKLFHYIKLQKQWLLSDLFVHPDHRGKGLSVALIDRSKQWCDETGACGLMLETEKTNIIGNNLYPKCDFQYDGVHNYYNWWK